MILKNIKIIFRELFKNKAINGINIVGLAIGIAAILIISQYIRFENSYDSFLNNNERIHRVVFYRHYTTGLDKSVGNNYMVGQIAMENIPEIENFLRCKKSTQFLQVNEEIFKEERVFFADSSFFDLFSYPVISGSKPDFLRAPNVAVITESTARKYFGNENPVGKTIYRVNPGKTPLVVQGVVKDVPPNSHLKFDMIISLSSLINPSYCYTCNNTNTYFLLREGSDPEVISAKITDLALQFLESKGLKLDYPIEFHLQNIRDIHLHSNYRFEHEINGNYVYQNKIRNINHKKPKNLVLVVQFSIAIFLIASTFVAIKQIRFMQGSALSMNMDQVLTVKRPVDRKYNAAQKQFEESIKHIPGITETTYSTVTPGEKNGWVKGGIAIKGNDKLSDQLYQSNVAPGFFDFFQVKLLAGRSFLPDETNWEGGSRHIILNKQAALALGASNYNDLLGKTLIDSDEGNDMGEIVGVVDGYFQNSLDQEVVPTIFNPDQFGYFLFLKIRGENPVELISTVKTEYQKYFKDSYFEYFFLDDFFNAQYQSHIQFNRCFILFSFMAIIISVLSLLGVVIMGSAARTKEIGIRKVNGARTWEILSLLNKDFMKGVVFSILIATPVAYYAMNKWLENFAYKTELSWWIFALAGLLALGIALLTVSWQSWRAATRNPVEALRYE